MVLGVARTKHQGDIASLCCKENQRHFSIRQLRRVSFPIIGFLIIVMNVMRILFCVLQLLFLCLACPSYCIEVEVQQFLSSLIFDHLL